MERDKYVTAMPDGSEEGVHPDSLEKGDFPRVDSIYSVIRNKCLDCAYSATEVRKCTAYKCPLWPYRLGRKPKALKSKRGYASGKT